MAKGTLQVITTMADQALSVANAIVRVYKDQNNEIVFEDYLITDMEGKTENLALDAPERSLSLNEDNRIRPYETYNVEVILKGYQTQIVQGVQIFANELSVLPIFMVPTNGLLTGDNEVDQIPDHHLLTNYGGDNINQSPANRRCVNDYRLVEEGEMKQPHRNEFILKGVVIPRKIRVHLGRPTANAENVTVDFIYYIKNVCSSEVYPTWPREALLANIHAQVSLALNRIYTEWYPSKGYNYDITNSTAFDQAFVKNRNIFESMSVLVDEVFNQYLRKRNFAEPFYSEYCDGKIAQCPGMKQWGTLTLANQGLSAIQILQRYYTTDVRLVTTERVEDVKGSYDGVLRVGSSGDNVTLIQEQLNAIAVNYPNITPIYPVDGIFGAATEEAVKVFQRQFNLTADGIIGKTTWYKINYIYLAVRKLAELTSIGRIENTKSGEWPGTVLREGSKGVDVQQLQYYLSVISTFQPQISTINTIDSRFGLQTERAVMAFQRAYGLTVDGIVGRTTWNAIYGAYSRFNTTVTPDDLAPQYPGIAIKTGASGTSVQQIQQALNIVGQEYTGIPVLVEDGVFGAETERAVRRFQQLFGLDVDGIVGVNTWNKLFETSKSIQQGTRPSPDFPTYPGTVLQSGSRGTDVRLIQERLNFIAMYYKNIPSVVADGIFGPLTVNAVRAFQTMLGLEADGIVGLQTWNRIMQMYNELAN